MRFESECKLCLISNAIQEGIKRIESRQPFEKSQSFFSPSTLSWQQHESTTFCLVIKYRRFVFYIYCKKIIIKYMEIRISWIWNVKNALLSRNFLRSNDKMMDFKNVSTSRNFSLDKVAKLSYLVCLMFLSFAIRTLIFSTLGCLAVFFCFVYVANWAKKGHVIWMRVRIFDGSAFNGGPSILRFCWCLKNINKITKINAKEWKKRKNFKHWIWTWKFKKIWSVRIEKYETSYELKAEN